MKNDQKSKIPAAPLVLGEPTVLDGNNIAVEFLRLPPSRARLWGLSRAFLNSLILPHAGNHFKPPVRSFVLRKPGAAKGVRLIDAQSLRNWINMHGG